eukprot:SAG31_NODE_13933_length_836_cov_10.845319_2_plen_98_part_00
MFMGFAHISASTNTHRPHARPRIRLYAQLTAVSRDHLLNLLLLLLDLSVDLFELSDQTSAEADRGAAALLERFRYGESYYLLFIIIRLCKQIIRLCK